MRALDAAWPGSSTPAHDSKSSRCSLHRSSMLLIILFITAIVGLGAYTLNTDMEQARQQAHAETLAEALLAQESAALAWCPLHAEKCKTGGQISPTDFLPDERANAPLFESGPFRTFVEPLGQGLYVVATFALPSNPMVLQVGQGALVSSLMTMSKQDVGAGAYDALQKRLRYYAGINPTVLPSDLTTHLSDGTPLVISTLALPT